MILFRSDFSRYPTAFPDYKTSNKTALHYAAVLDKLGVKNNVFHLTLLQKQLEGVDPHSPDLTVEQKARIRLECEHNPWYFYREVCRAPARGSPFPSQVKINRGNICLWWLFYNHVEVGLEQIRQTGKSLSKDLLNIDTLYIRGRNALISAITKDDGLRIEAIDRMKGIRNELPSFLVPAMATDADNQFELTCKHFKNRYALGIAQKSKPAANKLGRGFTSAIRDIDEGAFCDNISITLGAMEGSANAAEDAAKASGQPYGAFICTTAGSLDEDSGAFIYDIFQKGMPWTEHLLDCENNAELIEVIKRHCKAKRSDNKPPKIFVYASFLHSQLGYSNEWLMEKLAKNTGSPDAINKDYFNVWSSGKAANPLPKNILKEIRSSVKDVRYLERFKNGYTIRWYLSEDEVNSMMTNRQLIMGVDTSDAMGNDGISGAILDAESMMPVGTFSINETLLPNFCSFIGIIMQKYLGLVLVPERRSTGQSLIDHLLIQLPAIGIDPFKRIYNTIVQNREEEPNEFLEVNSTPANLRNNAFYTQRKKAFGIATTGASRDILYRDVFPSMARRKSKWINDKQLVDEIMGLVEKNGRIDHSSSSNDDMVIAWLLGSWFATYGRNLYYYGINASLIDSLRQVNDDPENRAEVQKELVQNQLRQEVKALAKVLADMKDNNLITIKENELRAIMKKMSNVGMEEDVISVDAMIEQYRESKAVEIRKNTASRAVLDRNKIWNGGYNHNTGLNTPDVIY